jgi:hypothetical protein
MLRLFSSLLVLLLGGTATPGPSGRQRRPVRLRGRRPSDEEGAVDRALEAAERPRARGRQPTPTWHGGVEFVHESGTVTVPGRWALEQASSALPAVVAPYDEAAPLPDPAHDPVAWAHRLRRVLALQEPGSRLAVEAADATGWQRLSVAVPTRPPTLVQVDRDALARLLGRTVVVRLRIDA